MDQKLADRIILEQLRPIYGFMLRKTATAEDAEDLTQETALRGYRALLRGTPEDPAAFLWRVARNALANYYRGKARSGIGVPLEDMAESLGSGEGNMADRMEFREDCAKIGLEIAYLSRLQREIVIAYYYDGQKVKDIAAALNIPEGTVKWHLFEARNNLKKGMDTMRNSSELKFNPVKFSLMGINGAVGAMGGTSNFFRGALSQNIAYAVYREAKSIHEIADALGVSPVYVESEAAFLEEYGFLIKSGDKYLANLIIEEGTEEIIQVYEEMYTKAAQLIGGGLFDALADSELLDSPSLYYPDGDKNFLMWGLLLYLLAWSNDVFLQHAATVTTVTGIEKKIKFEDVATLRPDGGRYIAYAGLDSEILRQKFFDSMRKWCGPMWNASDDLHLMLWQVNSEWSAREDFNFDGYQKDVERDLNLLRRFIDDEVLSIDDCAYLARRGYIRGSNGQFESAVIWLKSQTIKDELLALASRIKR